VLVALALDGLAHDGRSEDSAYLDRSLGTPLDDAAVTRLRTLIDDSGAHAQVEEAIDALAGRALDALDQAPVADGARVVLRELATAVTQRSL
jgi:geranylgeranyl diphosphate synthase type I